MIKLGRYYPRKPDNFAIMLIVHSTKPTIDISITYADGIVSRGQYSAAQLNQYWVHEKTIRCQKELDELLK